MTTRSSRVRLEHTQSFTYRYSGNPTNKKDLVSSIGRPGYIINKIKTRTETNILPWLGPFGSDGYPLPKGNVWSEKKSIPSIGHSSQNEGDDSVFMNQNGERCLVCDYARDRNGEKMVGYAQVWDIYTNTLNKTQLNAIGPVFEGSNLSYSLYGYTGCINASGSRIAITELGYNNYTGKVYIYEYDGENGWYLLGEPLTGNNEMEKFGNSICFDYTGINIAIGSMGYSVRDNNNNIIQKNVGKVAIYNYDYYEKKWSLYSDLVIKNTLRKNNGFNGEGGVKLDMMGTKLFIGSLKESSVEASLNDESVPHEGLVTVYTKRTVTENEFFNDDTVYRWDDEAYTTYFNNIPIDEFQLVQTDTNLPNWQPGGGGGPEYFKFVYDDKNGDDVLRFQVTNDPNPWEIDWYIFKGDYENGDVLTEANLIFITSLQCGDLDIITQQRVWDFDQILLPSDVTSWANTLNFYSWEKTGSAPDQGSKTPIDILLGGNNTEPNPFIQGETYTVVLADGYGDGWLNEYGDSAKIILTFDDSNPPAQYVHQPDRLHWLEHSKILGPKYVANSALTWEQSPYSKGERAGHITINKWGSRLAIGAPGYKWDGFNGRVRVLDLLNNNQWMQVGNDIIGDGDETGENIDLNGGGNFIIIGSGGAANPYGVIKVYQLHHADKIWNIIATPIHGGVNTIGLDGIDRGTHKVGNRHAPLNAVSINESGNIIAVIRRNDKDNIHTYFNNVSDPGFEYNGKGSVGYYRLEL